MKGTFLAVAAVLGVSLLTPRAAFCASTQGGTLKNHTHANANDGGSTLRPTIIQASNYVSAPIGVFANLSLTAPILPAGTILPYASSAPPQGFFECNGAAKSTTTYNVLYGVVGCLWGCSGANFNIPDLRGVFMRGWNHGITTTTYTGDFDAAIRSTITAGGATGDSVGTYENDGLASHTHDTYGAPVGFGTGGTTSFQDTYPTPGGVAGSRTTAQLSPAGDTRGKNAFVMFIIKYDNTTTGSTTTVQNSSFSFVTSATVSVNGSLYGSGATSTPLGVNSSSVAVFNANSGLAVPGQGFTVGTSSFAVAGGSATVAYRLTAQSLAGDGAAITGLACALGGGANSVLCQGLGDTSAGQYAGSLSGHLNTAGGYAAVIAGGESNNAGGNYGSVGGGTLNTAGAAVGDSFARVDGGYNNSVNSVTYGWIGGGNGHTVSNSNYSGIAAGDGNQITAGTRNFIGGGGGNIINGSASYGTIPGGQSNTVSAANSFAAGQNATAGAANAFTWSDGTSYSAHAANTFNVHSAKIYLEGDINVATNGGGVSFSTDSAYSVTVTTNFQITPIGDLRWSGGGLNANTISTYVVSAAGLASTTPFLFARSTITAGTRNDYYFGDSAAGMYQGRAYQGALGTLTNTKQISSGTYSTPQIWVSSPAAGTVLYQDLVAVSTGFAFLNTTRTRSLVDLNGLSVGGIGNPTILPSRLDWSTINQAGVLSIAMILDSTGTLTLGANAIIESDASVRLHLQGSSMTVEGQANVWGGLDVGNGSNISPPLNGIRSAGAVIFSSAVFVGTFLSTQAAGGAGASVTATCPVNTFAHGGGCSCSGAVAETANISIPNCVTQGCIPSGWTCQVTGGTGGACSSYAICSRLQ